MKLIVVDIDVNVAVAAGTADDDAATVISAFLVDKSSQFSSIW